jgi:hypothetical protein
LLTSSTTGLKQQLLFMVKLMKASRDLALGVPECPCPLLIILVISNGQEAQPGLEQWARMQ